MPKRNPITDPTTSPHLTAPHLFSTSPSHLQNKNKIQTSNANLFYLSIIRPILPKHIPIDIAHPHVSYAQSTTCILFLNAKSKTSSQTRPKILLFSLLTIHNLPSTSTSRSYRQQQSYHYQKHEHQIIQHKKKIKRPKKPTR